MSEREAKPDDVVSFVGRDGETREGTLMWVRGEYATIDAGGGCVWVTKEPLTIVLRNEDRDAATRAFFAEAIAREQGKTP